MIVGQCYRFQQIHSLPATLTAGSILKSISFTDEYMTGRVQSQTSYLSFVLHEQDLWVKFCSTQKCVNRNKMDKTAYIIWYEEQVITAPHAKTTPHDEQFCHLRLLVLWSNFVSHDHQMAPHEKFCSTDKVRRVCDKYDVCPDFDGQSGKGGLL